MKEVLEPEKSINLPVKDTVLLCCIHWRRIWARADRHVFKHLVFLILSQAVPQSLSLFYLSSKLFLDPRGTPGLNIVFSTPILITHYANQGERFVRTPVAQSAYQTRRPRERKRWE